MNHFFVGIMLTVAIILFLEIAKSLDKRLIGAITLVGISFIYIGFAWHDFPSLTLSIVSVFLFLLLAYYGYKKNFNLIVFGLVLHGLWDIVFPFFSSTLPRGYDVFCTTVDMLLALYFYFRVNPKKL